MSSTANRRHEVHLRGNSRASRLVWWRWAEIRKGAVWMDLTPTSFVTDQLSTESQSNISDIPQIKPKYVCMYFRYLASYLGSGWLATAVCLSTLNTYIYTYIYCGRNLHGFLVSVHNQTKPYITLLPYLTLPSSI